MWHTSSGASSVSFIIAMNVEADGSLLKKAIISASGSKADVAGSTAPNSSVSSLSAVVVSVIGKEFVGESPLSSVVIPKLLGAKKKQLVSIVCSNNQISLNSTICHCCFCI